MFKNIYQGGAKIFNPQVLRSVYNEKRLGAPDDAESKGGKKGETSDSSGSSSRVDKAKAKVTLTIEDLLGLLRIRVIRGINLAIRDVRTSDPYVVIKIGGQKVKTRVKKKTLNPEWNEDLTLPISDPDVSLKLAVYDYDTFSKDDKMGDAEFNVKVYIEALKSANVVGLPTGTVVSTMQPSGENCLARESKVSLVGVQLVQEMCLRLRNVECGEIEILLQWIDLPGCKGLGS